MKNFKISYKPGLLKLVFTFFIFANTALLYSQTPDFSGLKIMVNPGHGGNDSDDRGMPNGFWESESNLTKGLWLRDLLEARGAEVIMSRVLNRTEDDLPLSTIAAIANENSVDLFISIHSNAGNQASNYPLTIFNGKSETPSIPASKEWARILWEQLITNEATFWTTTAPRYIGDLTLNPGWTTGYGVLAPLEVPGIISEGSFHDYRPEMDRLLNLDYRQQEAWNMLYAMETYFELPGTETHGHIAGLIRDSLQPKKNYTIANSPDKYEPVNNARVKILETGDVYDVDNFVTGYYQFDSLLPGTYNLELSAPEYFTDTVTLMVNAHQFTYHNHWLGIDTTIAPELLYTTPADSQQINNFDPVSFTFDMNMDSASFSGAFSISPFINGSFTWNEDFLTVSFQPDIPYDKSTWYTITVDTTATQIWGVGLDTAVVLDFLTGDRNQYTLLSSFPSDDETVSPYLNFRLYFDAPLNSTSVIDAVEITDGEQILGTRGAIISNENGIGIYEFAPKQELDFNKNYTLTLSGSIQDENGIPLVNAIEIPFQTHTSPYPLIILNEMDTVEKWKLDVPGSANLDASSFIYKWGKTKRSGNASLLMRYFFTAAGGYAHIMANTPIELANLTTSAGLWIWGDLSKNKISLIFDSNDVIELCTLNFLGWDYHMVQLPQGATQITGIKVTHMPEGSLRGDIYFDALSQPDDTNYIFPITLNKVRVYPNPSNQGKFWLDNLPEGLVKYQLYNTTGSLIQTGYLRNRPSSIVLNSAARLQPLLLLRLSMDGGNITKLLRNEIID